VSSASAASAGIAHSAGEVKLIETLHHNADARPTKLATSRLRSMRRDVPAVRSVFRAYADNASRAAGVLNPAADVIITVLSAMIVGSLLSLSVSKATIEAFSASFALMVDLFGSAYAWCLPVAPRK
jgi:hypothetical protein